MANLELTTHIRYLKGVGPKMEGRLKLEFGIETVRDLLEFVPRKYRDYSKTVSIKDAHAGEEITIKAIVWESRVRPTRTRRKMLEAVFSDPSGTMRAVWFNQKYWAKQLKEGSEYYVSGKVALWRDGAFMNNPTIEPVGTDTLHTARIVPIYREANGIGSKYMRKLIASALPVLDAMPDELPANIISEHNVLARGDALRILHSPNSWPEIAKARGSLGFRELFLLLLSREMMKAEMTRVKAPSVKYDVAAIKKLLTALSFELTRDQKIAIHQIQQDMLRDHPMTRLLQGDVGSGKTLVAGAAMLLTAKSGFQSVLMAPTEILANQHYRTIKELLEPFGVSVSLITGSKKESKDADILVGTHALISEKRGFLPRLALAIIDEQHRFGVAQRARLMDLNGKSDVPHMLSMTATPIPRTLALTLFGDLDISTIREMPQGRQAIRTRVVPEEKRDEAYGFIQKQIKEGRQAFVITPLIDESDKLGVKAVTKEFAKLDKEIFPDIPMGILHGRLKSSEKEEVMRDFKSGKNKILVATPVVEVGVDVPNASVMMIESAQRFGLAQLHQIRGRVGRGEHQSYCFIFSDDDEEIPRLKALEETNDGFELAERDLKFRGPGEFTGTKQSGYLSLEFASIYDRELIERAREAAVATLERSSDLSNFPELKKKILHSEPVVA